jgi:preprotein translocase subunit SecD
MAAAAAAGMHLEYALQDLEQERALLEELRGQLLRTVSQLQIEESDLTAQLNALSAPTTTAELREALHSELFRQTAQPPPAPPACQAQSILESLIRSDSDEESSGDDDNDAEEEEARRWEETQLRLREMATQAAEPD